MGTSGQGDEVRKQRLQKGRCPVHGFVFNPVGSWYKLPGAEKPFIIGRCARVTCGIHAVQEQPRGPAVLLDERVSVVAYECREQPDGLDCSPNPVEVWPRKIPKRHGLS